MRIKRGICLSLCAFFICAAAGCGKEEESPEVFLSQEPSAQQEETEWNAAQINADMDADVLNTAETAAGNGVSGKDAVDVDLTQLSSTMVYSEVYNMMVYPEQYVGKKIKMEGQMSVYESPDQEGKHYFTVIIADATACCQLGIEFILKNGSEDPADYPEAGTEVCVAGEFQLYDEDGETYCHLVSSDILE